MDGGAAVLRRSSADGFPLPAPGARSAELLMAAAAIRRVASVSRPGADTLPRLRARSLRRNG